MRNSRNANERKAFRVTVGSIRRLDITEKRDQTLIRDMEAGTAVSGKP